MIERYKLNNGDDAQWIVYDDTTGKAVCVVWDKTLGGLAWSKRERRANAKRVLAALNETNRPAKKVKS